MSLPRCLSRDFFTTLADTISTATDKYFQETHDSPTAIRLLCLQQSCIADNKFLIETLDGSVPIEYKHTCLALVPPNADGDRQLIGKVISFNQFKVAPTKSRYLIILTRITIIPGDYRHLIGHLIPALIYHPVCFVTASEERRSLHHREGDYSRWCLPKRLAILQNVQVPELIDNPNMVGGPMRKPQEQLRNAKNVIAPYGQAKMPAKKHDISPVRISDLTLYTPKWLIRARVVHKSEIRRFNNQRGENQLFSVDLCDVNGEIRAVFFGEAVTKWYPFLEEGQVYSISGGQLKPSNKKFNTLKHQCEIVLDENSHIQLFQNDDTIPSLCCTFTSLGELDNVQVGETIDVLGVVVKTKEIQNIQPKGGGGTLDKRDVLICDSSGVPAWVTLWGPNSQILNNETNHNTILCLKGKLQTLGNDVECINPHILPAVSSLQEIAHFTRHSIGVKVSSWQGKRLDTQSGTHVLVEPVIPEALELRKWWNNNSHTVNIDVEAERPVEDPSNELVSISDIISATNQALQFKSIDSSGMVFTTRGLVEILRDTNFSWPACPSCRKKMVKKEEHWNCSRCNIDSEPVHSYILTMKIVDDTTHIWASALTNVGEDIMNGVNASDLVLLGEGGGIDSEGRNFSNIFEEARLNEFLFKIRATVENFMDEPKIKYRVTKATPVHVELDSSIEDRIKNIKKMLSV